MLRVLINNWWLLALRGIFALLFAGLAFSSRTVTGTWLLSAIALAGVVVFFGLLAIAAGMCTIVAGIRGASAEKSWLLFWDGVAVCVFGAVVLLAPELDFIWLARMLAVCAIVIGIVELLLARTLRRHVPDEWFLAVSGAASFCFGLYLLLLWTREAPRCCGGSPRMLLSAAWPSWDWPFGCAPFDTQRTSLLGTRGLASSSRFSGQAHRHPAPARQRASRLRSNPGPQPALRAGSGVQR